MSDLFVDMHRSRCRWQNHQNTPQTSTSTSTTLMTSDLPSSEQHVNDHIFSHHHNKSSTAKYDEDAAHNENYNFINRQKVKDDKHDNDNDGDDDGAFSNILSLKLRKPKHWKWELSTSKSCSNIALPRILLYDHKGELLVDAQGDNEGIYKQEDYEKSKYEKQSYQPKSEYNQRSVTTNLTHSIGKAVEKEFNGLHIQEATPSPEPSTSVCSHRSRKAINLNTTELPDYGLSRRSSSLKGVRFHVNDHEDFPLFESQIPEFLPTPPSTTTPTSSSSGPREKRKYRRSHSSSRSSAHSESILERFSYQKGRFSSPEFAEEYEIEQAPRYFWRTSNAGTIIVKDDSFNLHPRRRRRRPLKHLSSESLQNIQIPILPLSPTPKQSAGNSQSPSEVDCYTNTKRCTARVRHSLNNGNNLLNKQLSTSEEDVAVAVGQKQRLDNVDSRHSRKYAEARKQTKAITYSTDVHQNGKVR